MRGRPLRFDDFSGGLNTKAGPYGLGGNEASALLNFRPLVRGSLGGRLGDTEILDSAASLSSSAITSLARSPATGSGDADGLVIGLANGSLRMYNAGGLMTVGAYTAGAVWSFADAPAIASTIGAVATHGVNGTDAVLIGPTGSVATWDATAGTFPTGARYIAYVGNRMWAAGMAAYGSVADPASTLVFSEIGNSRNWPAANVVQFDPNDGETITAIGEVGAGLLVFKRSKAWLVYDLDTGANRPLGVGVGCISHRTICQTSFGTVFLGDGTVWVTDGTTTRQLSDNIEPTLRTAAATSGVLTAATATMDERRYVLALGGTLAGQVYEYDFDGKSWWRHDLRGGVLASARVNTNADAVYVGGSGGLDRVFHTGYLDAAGATLFRLWSGPLHTLGPGYDRLRGMEVEGSGKFGFYALAYNGTLTASSVRDEESLGATSTIRRESDFNVFGSVQVSMFATGVDMVTRVATPGYVAEAVQVDAYTLYVTRRAG